MKKPRLQTFRVPLAQRVVNGRVLITYLVAKFRGDTLIRVDHQIHVL